MKNSHLHKVAATGMSVAMVGVLFATIGCTGPTISRMTQFQQQQANLLSQQRLLTDKAQTLDTENESLQRQIAELDRRAQAAEERALALQDQLRSVNNELAETQKARGEVEHQFQTLTASLRRQSRVTIQPNNSLLQTLPDLGLGRDSVLRDGDVIRVRLPANRLFMADGSTLSAQGKALVLQAADELWHIYPNQMIGIEGHSSNEPVNSGQWKDPHHLSVARAWAVFNLMGDQTQFEKEQLLVTAHGPNNPAYSNQSAEGRQKNNRIELVIYPKTKTTTVQ